MATKQQDVKPLHLAKLHVHKGDTVLVLTGKDRGKRGYGAARDAPRSQGDRGGRQYRQEACECGPGCATGGDHREGDAAGRIERHGDLHGVWRADPDCARACAMGHDQKMRVRRVCKKCGQPIQEHTRE